MSKEVLAGIPLFLNLSPTELEKVAQLVEIKGAIKGQVLFKAGDPSDAFYIISRGRVKIAVPELGSRKEFSVPLGEGMFFGEIGVIQSAPRSATATVTDDAILLAIPKKSFDQLLATNADISEKIMREMNSRAKQLQEKPAKGAGKKKAKKVFVFYSPSGGAGCTFLACNVVKKIAHYTKKRTAMMDGDFQMGLAHVYLDYQKKRELGRVLQNNGGQVDSLAVTSACADLGNGIDFLGAPDQIEDSELINGEAAAKLVHELAFQHEHVVVDTTKDMNERTVSLFEVADQLVVVIEGTLAGIYRFNSFMTLYKKLGLDESKLLVVMNKYDKLSFPPEQVTKQVRREIAAVIDFDRPNVIKSLQVGKLLVDLAPECESGVQISNLARKLISLDVSATEAPKKSAGIGNLWGLLG